MTLQYYKSNPEYSLVSRMKKALVSALAGALVFFAATPRAQAAVSTWKIGDVFVAAVAEFDQDTTSPP